MDFENASHGVNIMGMNAYIEAVNSIVLTNVAGALRNTAEVEAAVRQGWHGASAEQFIANLNKAKEQMIETLKQLQSTFETELKGIQSQIIDMDANLVEEE